MALWTSSENQKTSPRAGRLRHQDRADPPAPAAVQHRPPLPDLEQGVQRLAPTRRACRASTRRSWTPSTTPTRCWPAGRRTWTSRRSSARSTTTSSAARQEGDYFTRRVREETKADEPQTRVTFPVALEGEFRAAALEAGVSPRLAQRAARPAGGLPRRRRPQDRRRPHSSELHRRRHRVRRPAAAPGARPRRRRAAADGADARRSGRRPGGPGSPAPPGVGGAGGGGAGDLPRRQPLAVPARPRAVPRTVFRPKRWPTTVL